MDIKSILLGGFAGMLLGFWLSPLATDTTELAVDTPAEEMEMTDEMDMTATAMQPEPVEVVDESTAPTIEIVSAERDEMGAYSVLVETSNFTFTPERIDDEPVQNEGHAHVYVDDVKVGREYAPWIYVPASYFSGEGPHEITVTLNANTHGEWTLLGAPIAASMMVE